MRHIQLPNLLSQIFADEGGKNERKRLHRAHKKLAGMPAVERKAHTDRNGPNKWKPLKDMLTGILGRKCWYTEVNATGSHLTIDHFRPVSKYWWLSFDPENYRVSCQWANSPEHNPVHGCAGGKGDNFPLLPPEIPARGKNWLRMEKPMLLDPCKSKDCKLLAFQADGRPVLNPAHAADPVAIQRVERSKILLNLDHPEFNAQREQLCRKIADDVKVHEGLSINADERNIIRARLAKGLAMNAEYSSAARQYLQFHRHLDWVEDILNTV